MPLYCLLRGARQVPFTSLAQSTRATVAAHARHGGGLGVLGLWRGATVLVLRGAGLTSGQMAGYDGTKTAARSLWGREAEGPALHVAASVHAAAWASTLCLPFDVLMSRFQNTAHSVQKPAVGAVAGVAAGPLSCAVELLRAEGPRVFFTGWLPMFVRLTPTFVVSAALFEQCRRVLGLAYFE